MKKIMMVALLAIAMICSLNANGQNVGQTFVVSGVTYKITSLSPNEVQLGSGSGGAFATNPTGSYTIPSSVTGGTGNLTYSVTSIGAYAFLYCSGLTGTLTIPNSVTSIGLSAFSGCSGLTSVTIGNSVTSIEQYAFYDCSSLTTISIPNSVTTIDVGAFYNCSGLTTISIPNSVTSIEQYAFSDCSSLTEITSLAVTPPTLGDYCFYNVPTTIPVHVPCESKTAYKTATGWSDFSNYVGLYKQ